MGQSNVVWKGRRGHLVVSQMHRNPPASGVNRQLANLEDETVHQTMFYLGPHFESDFVIISSPVTIIQDIAPYLGFLLTLSPVS